MRALRANAVHFHADGPVLDGDRLTRLQPIFQPRDHVRKAEEHWHPFVDVADGRCSVLREHGKTAA